MRPSRGIEGNLSRDHDVSLRAGMLPMLCIGHFLAMFDRHLVAVVAVPVAAYFRLDDAALGTLLGPAFAISYGVAAAALGNLANGRRRDLLLWGGLLMWTLASAAMAISESFAALVGARVTLGIGEGAFVPAALALIVERTPLKRRATALAWFTTGSTLGRSGALLVGGLLLGALVATMAAADAWRPLFLITAIPNLILLAALWFVRRADRADHADRVASLPQVGVHVGLWMRTHGTTLGLYMIIAIMPVMVLQAIAAWLPTLLARDHGLSVSQAGVVAGIVALVSATAGQLAGGQIFDRSARSRRTPAILLVVALAIGAPIAAVGANAGDLVAATLLIGIANIAFGIASFAGLYGVQPLVPASLRGTLNGMFMALITIFGAGLGPLLAGMFSVRGGGAGIGMAVAQVVLIAPIIAIGALLLMGQRYAVVTAAAAIRDDTEAQ